MLEGLTCVSILVGTSQKAHLKKFAFEKSRLPAVYANRRKLTIKSFQVAKLQ